MSVYKKNDNQPKVCNLNISFELDDVIEYPISIEKSVINKSGKTQNMSHVELESNGDENYYGDSEQTDENIHDHETLKVKKTLLNISFDCTDLEPILAEKEFTSTDEAHTSGIILY